MNHKYLHNTGEACQAAGINVPSEADGGLVTAERIPELSGLVTAGILRVMNTSDKVNYSPKSKAKVVDESSTPTSQSSPDTKVEGTSEGDDNTSDDNKTDELDEMNLQQLRQVAFSEGVKISSRYRLEYIAAIRESRESNNPQDDS